jgi:hypothetical protein
LSFIYFSAAPLGNKVLVNGIWVCMAIITGAVGGATNAIVQTHLGGGKNGNTNPGNNAPAYNNTGTG